MILKPENLTSDCLEQHSSSQEIDGKTTTVKVWCGLRCIGTAQMSGTDLIAPPDEMERYFIDGVLLRHARGAWR
jgi:hypothetical protein